MTEHNMTREQAEAAARAGAKVRYKAWYDHAWVTYRDGVCFDHLGNNCSAINGGETGWSIVEPAPAFTTTRAKTQPLANLYRTAAWVRLANSTKERDHYTCKLCGTLALGKGQCIADHIRPHRGDEALFWNPNNLQCLCKACHDSVKQREEKGTRMQRVDGW